MSDLGISLRIRKEAETICNPYKILVANVDQIPGGFAVTIFLPNHFQLNSPEVLQVRSQLEAIEGVSSVFVQLAPNLA